MASERRNGETLGAYRDRLNREFDEKFPELVKYQLSRPWDELDDLWFEAVTGETISPDERAARNPDL